MSSGPLRGPVLGAPVLGAPVLSADAMRAAEAACFTAEKPALHYMEKAGRAVARLALRIAAGRAIIILAGPGNNGGDGYVAARYLREAGAEVRVIAVLPPKSEGALWARGTWQGAVEPLADETAPAPILIDAIFGTGARGGLDPAWAADALRLFHAARYVLAVDLPSALNSDDPDITAPYAVQCTLALGALKPAHVLQPSAPQCGTLLLDTLDIPVDSDVRILELPMFRAPGPDDHKYRRGMVAIIAGQMPGAAALAARAATYGGAGYILFIGECASPHLPDAVVRRPSQDLPDILADKRLNALVIGPGAGRDAPALHHLETARISGKSLVIDGDALHLLDADKLFTSPTILTPHEGEFSALFGSLSGTKIDRALEAARTINAVVVYKGADTVIAAPDGQVRIAPAVSPWLASAGTGDVLAGLCGSALARTPDDPFGAASLAVWLHGEAARLAGPALIADDLIDHLPAAVQRALP